MGDIPYLADAAAAARRLVVSELIAAVSGDIRQHGYWQRTTEWRIFTETTSRIEVERDQADRRWYKVTVDGGDSTMICRCPTLERALEFVGLYEQLIRDSFYTLGWASQPAKGRRKPRIGEKRP
jgi:hypothetical protein